MSFQNFDHNSAYGFNNSLQPVINPPIIANRAPTNNDLAEVGSQWLDQSAGNVYFLVSVKGAIADWVAAAGNAINTSSLTIDPGPFTVNGSTLLNGNINSPGVITLEATGGATSSIVIESVSGTAADSVGISSAVGGIEVSTANASGNIVISSNGGGTVTVGSTGNTGTNDLLLNVNGGTNSKLLINNELSTDVAAIKMLSPVGGIEITTEATLKNVVLDSVLGFIVAGASDTCVGVDILNITPTVNRTTTINTNVVSTAVTDQIDIGTGGVDTNAGAQKIINIGTGATLLGTQEVNISTGTATTGTKQVNIGNADALTQLNALGVVQINASGAGTTVIGNTISGGATTIDSTGVITVESTAASATAIHLNASGAAGGITMAAGNNGIAETSTGAISITSSDGLSNAITLAATGAGGGVSIAPTNTTVAVGIANVIPTVARTTSINAGAVGSAVADTLNLGSGATNFAGASKVVNIGTGNNTLGTDIVNISTGTAASGTKAVNMGNADGLTTITELGVMNINTAGTGATTLGSTATGGAVALNSASTITSLAPNVNINNSGTGATTVGSTATGTAVAVNSSTTITNLAPNVNINNSGTGATTIGSIATGTAVAINSSSTITALAPNVNINNSSTGATTIGSATGGTIIAQSSTAAATAIQLNASAAAGGITATVGSNNFNVTGGNIVSATGNIVVSTAAKGILLPGSVALLAGAGDPNASVTAAKGSLFMRTDGSSTSTRAYINTDSATAWTAITTAS